MDNLFTYLLKVSVGTSFLYLIYLLFFRNDTFYLRNRIFLIMILLLPPLFPLLNLSNNSINATISEPVMVMNNIIISGTTFGISTTDKINPNNNIHLFNWIYFLVASIFMSRALFRIATTYKIIRKGFVVDPKFPRVIISDQQHPPFSFFPYIVIPRNNYEGNGYRTILDHENAHIIQGHTFDMLLSELVIVVQWFNPFVYLLKRSIILNHEFLADNFTLRKSISFKGYQYLLLYISTNFRRIPLTHNFSSSIKNRIAMINKKPTRGYAALKSLLILPATMILILAFSCTTDPVLLDIPDQQPLLADLRMDGSMELLRFQPLFSAESQSKLTELISDNMGYPEEAKNAGIYGKFFVVVKMAKGGQIESATIKNINSIMTTPFAYSYYFRIWGEAPTNTDPMRNGTDLTILTNEGLRISKMIETLNLPELRDEIKEFVIPFSYVLSFNFDSTYQIKPR
jgi:beta-lactamase regulating signal transducer with metallopeptidase domain